MQCARSYAQLPGARKKENKSPRRRKRNYEKDENLLKE